MPVTNPNNFLRRGVIVTELVYVKIGKRIKRISLQRYLVTKITRDFGRVTNYDLLALYENQLWLERKCLTDKDFCSVFGESLGVISQKLKEVNFSKDISPSSLRLLAEHLKELTCFLIPSRNYSSFKTRFAGSFQILPAKQPGLPVRSLPPKRFIGKGYGDKGTLKNEAIDGSPSWQEISSSRSRVTAKEAEELIYECESYEELKHVFLNLFYWEGPLPLDWRHSFKTTSVSPEEARKIEVQKEVLSKFNFSE